jgi:ADP-dependent NAD(P)H-hydrate dehydratase
MSSSDAVTLGSSRSDAIEVDSTLLAGWPLPDPNEANDKEERGSVLLVGGSKEMPGAIILAATAAMRAGAGKLCIATAESVAALVAQVVPEARVIALAETPRGGLRTDDLAMLPKNVDAVLIGPGMQDEAAAVQLTLALLTRYPDAKFVLDTLAMSIVRSSGDRVGGTHPPAIVVTPHPGEMAHLTGIDKKRVVNEMHVTARHAAQEWQVLVALKSATTVIAHPNGQAWTHTGGNSGLAISGSGDVLAGIIAGLCSRGAQTDQAAIWGVAVHGRSGNALAQRIGPIGFLAREIADEIPRLMRELSPQR